MEGDAHCGATVQHRSRMGRGRSRPNLRQVHLIAAELHLHCLMAATLARDERGRLIRKAGVMAVVATGGEVALAADRLRWPGNCRSTARSAAR